MASAPRLADEDRAPVHERVLSDFEIREGLTESERILAANLYFSGFERELGVFFGPPSVGIPLLSRKIALDRCFCAYVEGDLAALMGLGYAGRSFVTIDREVCVRRFGRFFGAVAWWFTRTMERPVPPDTLYIDGLIVAPEFRRKRDRH